MAKVIVLSIPVEDITNMNNIRPISLLNTLNKLSEKLSLRKFSLENNILIEEQFSFRTRNLTMHKIVPMADYIMDNFNINKHTGFLF